MSKVDPSKGKKKRPKLTVDHLDGDVGVLTIASYEEALFEGDLLRILRFQETGDLAHFLNVTQTKYLCERLGDESDEWIGQKIPLEKHTSEFGGEAHINLWVSAPESWDAIFEQAGLAVPHKRRTRTVAPVAATTGKKVKGFKKAKRVGGPKR